MALRPSGRRPHVPTLWREMNRAFIQSDVTAASLQLSSSSVGLMNGQLGQAAMMLLHAVSLLAPVTLERVANDANDAPVAGWERLRQGSFVEIRRKMPWACHAPHRAPRVAPSFLPSSHLFNSHATRWFVLEHLHRCRQQVRERCASTFGDVKKEEIRLSNLLEQVFGICNGGRTARRGTRICLSLGQVTASPYLSLLSARTSCDCRRGRAFGRHAAR